MTTARTLGHLALYYRPGDMEASRRLLQDLGCTLVENGPRPGEDGFCTVLVDDETANHADNILFLAPVSPKQEELERAIREQFGDRRAGAADAATAFTDMKRDSPETASHFAIRYRDFETLEHALLARWRPTPRRVARCTDASSSRSIGPGPISIRRRRAHGVVTGVHR